MFSNGEIKEYFNKRVIDIVSILKDNKDGLKDAIVADKIIGKVAATLMTKAGVKKVYSKTLSKFGKDVFDNNNIPYEYDIITEYGTLKDTALDNECSVPTILKYIKLQKPYKGYYYCYKEKDNEQTT